MSWRRKNGQNDLTAGMMYRGLGILMGREMDEEMEDEDGYILRRERAETYLAKALAIHKSALPAEDAYIADAELEIAKCLSDDPEGLQKAKEMLEVILKKKRENVGDIHPDVARLLIDQANVHLAMEEYEMSQGCFSKAANILSSFYGVTHKETREAYDSFSLTLQEVRAGPRVHSHIRTHTIKILTNTFPQYLLPCSLANMSRPTESPKCSSMRAQIASGSPIPTHARV